MPGCMDAICGTHIAQNRTSPKQATDTTETNNISPVIGGEAQALRIIPGMCFVAH